MAFNEAPAPSGTGTPPIGPQNEKVNILLVDDREENLISLAAVLDRSDYRLLKAKSGPEALKWLMDEDFALILMDVQMPGMDGFETAALIKQRERSRNIPIIFVTAISREEPFVFKGYDAGAVDYIMKPFEPSVLRSKVAVFAELHRKNLILQYQARLLRENERLEQERELARREMLHLREREANNRKYRELVDGIRNGIVWSADALSLKLGFVSAQAETLLGYSTDALLKGTPPWVELIHPEDRGPISEAIRAGRKSDAEMRFEHRFVHASGEELWFQTSVRIGESSEGRSELRGLSVDITALKTAERSLQQAVRARDEFLSIASHELKTPLTPLSLQLQVLKRISQKKNSSQEILEKLGRAIDSSERQVERLARLVDELLDVSRINHGKLELEPEEVDLWELVHDVSARFSEQLARVGCDLRINATEGTVGTWDRLRLEQIFVNLLTNAAKYGAGRPITVHVEKDAECATLKVGDEGIGIASQDQIRIFDQYERAVSASNFGGLGLGLFIVRQIVEAHGGTIGVESEQGKGSVFTVRLPLQPAGIHSNGLTLNNSPEGTDIKRSAGQSFH